MIRYGSPRRTWHGDPKEDIDSRQHPPYVRPVPYIGRVLIDYPGFLLDWTQHQDTRDPRRFRSVDLVGIQHEHCAPRELMRRLATIVPLYSRAGRSF